MNSQPFSADVEDKEDQDENLEDTKQGMDVDTTGLNTTTLTLESVNQISDLVSLPQSDHLHSEKDTHVFDTLETMEVTLESSIGSGIESEDEPDLIHEDDILSLFNNPLAELVRPTDLKLYVGQEHLINDGNGLIKNFIRLGYLPSMILHGPPGVGKTTIASILARETKYVFLELSATNGTVADLKRILRDIENENSRRQAMKQDTMKVVLFIDEIHRFSTTQQDFLLPYIENGQFVFIGATLVNPKLRIRRAILSRCQIFQLKSLTNADLVRVIKRAILFENIRRRCSHRIKFIELETLAIDLIVSRCKGDSRSAINMVELISGHVSGSDTTYTVGDHNPVHVTCETVVNILRNNRENVSGLKDQRNLNLLLKLFDSLKNVSRRRILHHIEIDKDEVSTDIDEDDKESIVGDGNKYDEIEEGEDITEPTKNTASESMSPCPRVVTSSQTTIPPDKLQESSQVVFNESQIVSQSLIKEVQVQSHNAKLNNEPHRRKLSGNSKVIKRRRAGSSTKFTKLLSKYPIDELLLKVQNSDDSDISDNDELLCDSEEVGIADQFLDTDRYTFLATYQTNWLIERGESPLFLLKQLILFTCLYPDCKVLPLPEITSMIKVLKHTSADPRKVLANLVHRITRARQLPIKDAYHDPVRRLKAIKSYCVQEFAEVKVGTEHIMLPDLPISYEQSVVDDLTVQLDFGTTPESDTFPVLPILDFDPMEHGDLQVVDF